MVESFLLGSEDSTKVMLRPSVEMLWTSASVKDRVLTWSHVHEPSCVDPSFTTALNAGYLSVRSSQHVDMPFFSTEVILRGGLKLSMLLLITSGVAAGTALNCRLTMPLMVVVSRFISTRARLASALIGGSKDQMLARTF